MLWTDFETYLVALIVVVLIIIVYVGTSGGDSKGGTASLAITTFRALKALAAADGVVNESEIKLMKTVGERFQTKYPEIALSTFLDPDYLASLPPLRPAELKGSGLTPSQGQMLLVLLAHVGYACAPSPEL